MINPRTASYREIQIELKANNLTAKGGHQELIERLEKFYASQLTDEPTLQELLIAADKVNAAVDDLEDKGIVDKEVLVNKGPVSADGFCIYEIVDEINHVFGGNGTAVYNTNNPQVIEFHGGPLDRQETTVNQDKAVILHFARGYSYSFKWPAANTEALGASASAIGGRGFFEN